MDKSFSPSGRSGEVIKKCPASSLRQDINNLTINLCNYSITSFHPCLERRPLALQAPSQACRRSGTQW